MKQYINNLLGLITIIGMIACTDTPDAHEDEHGHEEEENTVELNQKQLEIGNIKYGKISKYNIGNEMRVNGTIELPPQSDVSINIPYGGFVKYNEMLPGTPVRKGQLLVRIENPDFIQFQQDYLEGLVSRDYLLSEFERQEELYKENVASGKTFEKAKRDYLANEVRIKTMEARLRLIGFNLEKVSKGSISSSVGIYSPVSGSIREVYTNVGKYIGPEDVIMDITNSDDLHVELTVYENDIPNVQVGQRIRFKLANSNAWREAEVFLIGSNVREDRSVTVHGHLKGDYPDLLPGMYVTAKLEINAHQVWAIKDTEVVRFQGKEYVFAFKGNRKENGESMFDFEMLEVDKGVTEDGFTEISLKDGSDLSKLDLVTDGAFTLLAKAKNSESGHHH